MILLLLVNKELRKDINLLSYVNKFLILILMMILSMYKFDFEFYIFLISWILNVIIILNVKKIKKEKYEKYLTFLRRTFYLFPLIFPIIFIDIKEYFIWNFYSIAFGIIIGFLFLASDFSTYKLFLSKDYILFVGKEKVYKIIGNIYSLIFGAIFEEIYFKAVVINILQNYIGIYSVIMSSYLFFLHHYLTKKFDKFSKKDFCIQILFSLLTSLIYYKTENLLIGLVAHTIYNMPLSIYYIKRGMIE